VRSRKRLKESGADLITILGRVLSFETVFLLWCLIIFRIISCKKWFSESPAFSWASSLYMLQARAGPTPSQALSPAPSNLPSEGLLAGVLNVRVGVAFIAIIDDFIDLTTVVH
jgi:hypothetical protein